MSRTRLIGAFCALTLIFPVFYSNGAEPSFKALVFTRTLGFRHDSIPATINAIKSLGSQNNFTVVQTEDPAAFNDTNLAQYQTVIFAHTSGAVLDANQESAFRRYIDNGGGFVGIHSAADTMSNSAWFVQLVGAQFASHPAGTPTAKIKVADAVHPSSAGLPRIWTRTDEWYNFISSPRGKVHVLATVDESTYGGGSHGADHPIAWCQQMGPGRSWYTAMGHTSNSWSEPALLNHVLGGIKYTAKAVNGDCGATVASNFDKVVMLDQISQPMSLAVAPDKRVFILERYGKVKIFKPDLQDAVVAGSLNVSAAYDHGLQGIALDPAFSTNGWIYLFYTAPPANGAKSCPEYALGDVDKRAPSMGDGCEVNRLSRFKVNGDKIDLASEKVLLSFPILNHCCHQGGSLAFDRNGNLYLSTGDDASAFESQGYTPIDERGGKVGNDAQRTSGNPHDLRGKILRIRPQADGTYTIPAGNLFNGSNGRSEVYVMGVRNPFRMSLDPATSDLYWGDVGPDAGSPDGNRGPDGHDEINRASSAGNFGWPYCLADNKPYHDFDFATNLPKGGNFECVTGPTNDSPYANPSGGSQVLPPAKPALLWYPYGLSKEFPELGTGSRTAETGPLYRYDAALVSDTKLPAYYDNTLFVYDWSRGWIKEVKLNADGSVLKINPFIGLPDLMRAPIDMELGPEGSFYMLDWGNDQDYVQGSDTADGKLIRFDYVNGKRSPVAITSGTSALGGPAPLTVQFSAVGSYDPDPEDMVVAYAWDFTNDGTVDASDQTASYTYPKGDYTARLTITDTTGKSSITRFTISSGNSIPLVTIESPTDGRFYRVGETVPYRIKVTDAEDGSTEASSIDCSRVRLSVALGHDYHSHPLQTLSGCEGSFVSADGGHSGAANIYTVITASYTDRGAPGVSSRTGIQTNWLQPNRKQAEAYSSMGCDGTNSFKYCGVETQAANDQLGGGDAIAYTHSGDWIAFKRMSLEGITSFGYRAGAANGGGRIEVHLDSPAGPLVSTAQIPTTGSWNSFGYSIGPVVAPPGDRAAHDLYFVFKGPIPAKTGDAYLDGDMPLFLLNWIDIYGVTAGMTPLKPSLSPRANLP